MRGSRLRLLTIAVLATLCALAPSAAQAATYSAGAYSGKISQVVPKRYTGQVSFVVAQGKVTGLTLSFGVACQGLGWVHEKDPLPTLTIGIGPAGGFSYVGEVGRGRLRISGVLTGRKAVGSVFQTLWFGHTFCTMNRPAFYSASR